MACTGIETPSMLLRQLSLQVGLHWHSLDVKTAFCRRALRALYLYDLTGTAWLSPGSLDT